MEGPGKGQSKITQPILAQKGRRNPSEQKPHNYGLWIAEKSELTSRIKIINMLKFTLKWLAMEQAIEIRHNILSTSITLKNHGLSECLPGTLACKLNDSFCMKNRIMCYKKWTEVTL